QTVLGFRSSDRQRADQDRLLHRLDRNSAVHPRGHLRRRRHGRVRRIVRRRTGPADDHRRPRHGRDLRRLLALRLRDVAADVPHVQSHGRDPRPPAAALSDGTGLRSSRSSTVESDQEERPWLTTSTTTPAAAATRVWPSSSAPWSWCWPSWPGSSSPAVVSASAGRTSTSTWTCRRFPLRRFPRRAGTDR